MELGEKDNVGINVGTSVGDDEGKMSSGPPPIPPPIPSRPPESRFLVMLFKKVYLANAFLAKHPILKMSQVTFITRFGNVHQKNIVPNFFL